MKIKNLIAILTILLCLLTGAGLAYIFNKPNQVIKNELKAKELEILVKDTISANNVHAYLLHADSTDFMVFRYGNSITALKQKDYKKQ